MYLDHSINTMEMVDLAREAFRSSNYDLATGIYDKLLREHGQNMEWLVGKAASLAKQHQFNEALSCLRYACRLGSLQPNTFMILIEPVVDYITRRAGRAIHAFRRKDVGQYSCWLCFGILYEPITIPCGHSFCRDCLKDVQCLRTCHICRKRHPSLKLQNLQVNVSLRDGFEKYFPQEMKGRKLKQDGNTLFKDGQYHRALEKYTAAIQVDQNDHLSLSNRSHVFNTLDSLDSALKDAEMVCQLRPNWPKGYYRKASVLFKMGQYDAALLAYLQCLTLDPTVTSAKEAIAKIMFLLLSKQRWASGKHKAEPIHPAGRPHSSNSGSGLNILTTSNLSELITMLINILEEKSPLPGTSADAKGARLLPEDPESMDAIDADRNLVGKAMMDKDTKDMEKTQLGASLKQVPASLWGSLPGGSKQREIRDGLVVKEDYECSLCYRLFYHPITTPCGHTFCKECIYRALDYNNRCPLCKGCLAEFLSKRCEAESVMISEIIQRHLPSEFEDRQTQQHLEWEVLSLGIQGGEAEWIPVFVCTQPFPTVPCPLHIFEPRYRLMIRQCMESGSQQFGMCTPSDNGFSEVGVMLVIREVNHLEDGRSIIDTIGGRRFSVLERGMRDGYHTAKVTFFEDIRLEGEDLQRARQLNDTVYTMASTWYNNLLIPLKLRIDQHFGAMPAPEPNLQENPDGPKWVWWLSAILPIDTSLQQQIVSKRQLQERLLILQRTLARLSQS